MLASVSDGKVHKKLNTACFGFALKKSLCAIEVQFKTGFNTFPTENARLKYISPSTCYSGLWKIQQYINLSRVRPYVYLLLNSLKTNIPINTFTALTGCFTKKWTLVPNFTVQKQLCVKHPVFYLRLPGEAVLKFLCSDSS